jgi:hypothetical protein
VIPNKVIDTLQSNRYQKLDTKALKDLDETIKIAHDVLIDQQKSSATSILSLFEGKDAHSIVLTAEPNFLREDSGILLQKKEKDLKQEKALIYQHQ